MKRIQVGDKVKVNLVVGVYQLIDAQGTVFYIDEPNLFNDWVSPIQVELVEPYDKHNQRMVRLSLKELKVVEESEEA